MPKIRSPNRAGTEPEQPATESILDLDTLASIISAAQEQGSADEALHTISYHLVGPIDEDRTREVSTIMREANNAVELSHVWLYITSFGGVLDYALAMYDAIRCVRHPVYTIVAGSADSAATIVALSGDRRFILPNATMTVHPPSVEIADGNDIDVAAAEKLSEHLSEGLRKVLAIYTERTKLSRSKAETLCRATTTLSAKEAQRYGFVHKIVPYAQKPKRAAPSPFSK